MAIPTRTFKDLVVWQKAKNLTVDVYKNFGGVRDFGFKDQIQRASVSTMNNIAEGYARRSDKAFKNYLMIAKGSAAEVQSMLLLSAELKYIDDTQCQKLLMQTEELLKMLTTFIKRL